MKSKKDSGQLSLIVTPQSSLTALSDVINVANITTDKAILKHPGFEYIGRENIGLGLKASPLRNKFVIGADGDRNQVCELYLDRILNPALDGDPKFSAQLEELHRLAQRVIDGDTLVLGCYCQPARCHGFDVAAAIRAIANERKPQPAPAPEKPAPFCYLPFSVGAIVRLRIVPQRIYKVIAVKVGVPTECSPHPKVPGSEAQHIYTVRPLNGSHNGYWYHHQLEVME